jgi:hypothetical protein
VDFLQSQETGGALSHRRRLVKPEVRSSGLSKNNFNSEIKKQLDTRGVTAISVTSVMLTGFESGTRIYGKPRIIRGH